MMQHSFVQGVVIGLVFGVPLGAVGAICMQRTINDGPLAGFVTGSASSLADGIYAVIGTFSLKVLSDFLMANQVFIHLFGALCLILVAVKSLVKKEGMTITRVMERKTYVKYFLSSFVISIANPAAVLSFIFAFYVVGVDATMGILGGVQLVVGVLCGTLAWWLLLVFVINSLKQRVNAKWIYRSNIVFSIVLMIFASGLFFRTLCM